MSRIEVSCRQIEILKTLLYHHVDDMVDWCRFLSDDEEHLNDVLDDILLLIVLYYMIHTTNHVCPARRVG